MHRVAKCVVLVALWLVFDPRLFGAEFPDVDKKLAQIDAQLDGLKTDVEALEKQCLRLLDEDTLPADRGKVYAQIARVYAQSGLAEPEKTAQYCETALKYPLDAAVAGQMHVFWADALRTRLRSAKGDARAAIGKQLAVRCLHGLTFILEQNAPKDIQSVPVVHRFDHVGSEDDAAYRQLVQKNKEEVAARERAITLNALVRHRRALTEKIVEVYFQGYFTRAEFAALAGDILADREAVENLIARVQRTCASRPRPDGSNGD